jgi:Fe-S cluster assembly protein SufD
VTAAVALASQFARDPVAADFARIAPALPGANLAWLAKLRRQALERFIEHGLPTTREEAWKYTNVAPLAKRPYTTGTSGDAPLVDVAAFAFPGLAAHLVVFVDGRFSPALSRIGTLPAGCTLASVADVLAREPERLEAAFAAQADHTIFADLNAAFMRDGLYLHLAQGVALEAPVHALFVTTRDDVVTHPRNVVVAEARAQAFVIEHHVSAGAASYFTNAVTRIMAGANASVGHCKLQQEGARAFHIAGVHVTQARSSRFESQSIALGAALSRADIATVFDDEGCEASLAGLYLVGGRQHVDHHTLVDHAKPHGTSRELYKGVIDDGARGVFNGRIVVRPNAQKTDAHLANHNLLLSKSAEIDTKPELTIDADDVKCSHGATVGQLDETALFYLRSRAIDPVTARALLTYAFAHDVVERIRLAPLRTALERTLLARLPQADRLRELSPT